MSASHTPGPWRWDGAYTLRPVTPAPERSAVHTILSPDGCFGYLGKSWREIEPEDDANHALIAAAPELLSALRGLVDGLANDDYEGLIEHAPQMAAARAAIAAAIGVAP